MLTKTGISKIWQERFKSCQYKITGGLVRRPYFWLLVRPHFFFEVPKWLSIKKKNSASVKGLFPDLALYKTSLEISISEVVGYKTSLLKIFTPKWLPIRPYGDENQRFFYLTSRSITVSYNNVS